MKNTYRNIFFIVGCVAVLLMVITMDISMADIKDSLRVISFWFPFIIVLWLFIYMLNAYAWQIIVNSGRPQQKVGFWRIYKYTITGFALNSVTPMGLMGGEPYRIMETMPYVGVEKATSSVVLYVMMHIFSHFCFWLFSVVLYLMLYSGDINAYTAILLLITVFVCSVGIYFFLKGYRSGMVVKLFGGLSRIPLIKKKAGSFLAEKQEKLESIDRMIAELHVNHKGVFYTSLFSEFMARVVSCAEVYVILSVFVDSVSYADCIIILAFTSLFANAMFFLPLQLGAREGGFAMIVNGLSFPYSYGVFMGIIIRLRELVCVFLGLALMKIYNKTTN